MTQPPKPSRGRTSEAVERAGAPKNWIEAQAEEEISPQPRDPAENQKEHNAAKVKPQHQSPGGYEVRKRKGRDTDRVQQVEPLRRREHALQRAGGKANGQGNGQNQKDPVGLGAELGRDLEKAINEGRRGCGEQNAGLGDQSPFGLPTRSRPAREASRCRPCREARRRIWWWRDRCRNRKGRNSQRPPRRVDRRPKRSGPRWRIM